MNHEPKSKPEDLAEFDKARKVMTAERLAAADDVVERYAIRCALGNNGGTWATHYNEDQKNVWRAFVRDLMSEADATADWAIERKGIIAALRALCADFGDNDWPDDLDLRDVIEKHLGKHLHVWGPRGHDRD